MLRARFIPVLQLLNGALVKTVRFRNPAYIGDPVNTVRIFNELEVDELCFLDIRASAEQREPDYALLQQLSDEAFCPVAYGGGIHSVETAEKVFALGFEKIVLNTAAHRNPALLTDVARRYGSQAVIASMDAQRSMLGGTRILIGGTATKDDVVARAKALENAGAGEILLTDADREGTWQGYNVALVRQVSDAVRVPVVAHGGAGSVADVENVIKNGRASAAAAGSLVIYQKRGMGILINMPDRSPLDKALNFITPISAE
jgi:cyclase